MLTYIVMALFYLLFPALVIWLCVRFPLANKIGAVLLCYIGGMIFGNLGIVPQGAEAFQNTLTEVLIALGISMLLFTIDIREWKLTAGKAILSFGWLPCPYRCSLHGNAAVRLCSSGSLEIRGYGDRTVHRRDSQSGGH